MNMEQFQMIMDLLQNVTDGAYTVAILYMIFVLLVDFVMPLAMFVLTFVVSYKLIRRVIEVTSFTRELRHMRNLVTDRQSVRGVDSDDVRKIVKWVEEKKKYT